MNWLLSLRRLFFPSRCLVCGRELLQGERYLCMECKSDIPYTHHWEYSGNAAEDSISERIPFERYYSLFFYGGGYKELLYAVKYRNGTALAFHLGRMLGERMAGTGFDYIVPVPLNWRKRWRRGYNQARLIAEGIVCGMGRDKSIIREDLIKRVRFTNTQTSKEREERFRNVEGAFALTVRFAKEVQGMHILVVDDVLTTGATMEACAKLLIERYNCKISFATLAYDE